MVRIFPSVSISLILQEKNDLTFSSINARTTHSNNHVLRASNTQVLRRICGENDIEGQSWIQAAELARKCRRFQYASKALLNASAYVSSIIADIT